MIQIPNLKPKLMGFIDLVDDKSFIRDHKTKAKSPGAADAVKSLQLKIYALGYRTVTGELEKGRSLDCIIKTKEPKFVRLDVPQCSQFEIDETMEVIKGVGNCITGGYFYKSKDGWHCSRDYCGYYDLCNGGK